MPASSVISMILAYLASPTTILQIVTNPQAVLQMIQSLIKQTTPPLPTA